MKEAKIHAISLPRKNIHSNIQVPNTISIWKGTNEEKALYNLLRHHARGKNISPVARTKYASQARRNLIRNYSLEAMSADIHNLVKEIVEHNQSTYRNQTCASAEIGLALYDMDIARSKAEAMRLGEEAIRFYYITKNN